MYAGAGLLPACRIEHDRSWLELDGERIAAGIALQILRIRLESLIDSRRDWLLRHRRQDRIHITSDAMMPRSAETTRLIPSTSSSAFKSCGQAVSRKQAAILPLRSGQQGSAVLRESAVVLCVRLSALASV
jgi:hypothetical protein